MINKRIALHLKTIMTRPITIFNEKIRRKNQIKIRVIEHNFISYKYICRTIP